MHGQFGDAHIKPSLEKLTSNGICNCNARQCGHLSQPEDYGGQGDDSEVVSGGLFVSGCDASKLFQLGETAFDEVTFGVSGFVERVFDGARWIVGMMATAPFSATAVVSSDIVNIKRCLCGGYLFRVKH